MRRVVALQLNRIEPSSSVRCLPITATLGSEPLIVSAAMSELQAIVSALATRRIFLIIM